MRIRIQYGKISPIPKNIYVSSLNKVTFEATEIDTSKSNTNKFVLFSYYFEVKIFTNLYVLTLNLTIVVE